MTTEEEPRPGPRSGATMSPNPSQTRSPNPSPNQEVQPGASSELPVPYNKIGGEPTVRALVDRFYDLMDELEEVQQPLRAMHAKSLKASREKLFLFLSGWLGGPQLYVEKYGHPLLRARHIPFSIGTVEAEQWMYCMRQALSDVVEDEVTRAFMDRQLTRLASHMRNRDS